MRMSPACGRGWLSSAVRAGSSATFIYTKAMTQASFANAAEFFNSLLERILHPLQGGMASVLDLDPAWGAASRHLG